MRVDTLHWYPQHIQRMKEYVRLTAGVDSELSKAWDAVELLMQNQYLDTMDAQTCYRYEQFLGIVASPLDSLDDRRRRIKGYFASNLPYTEIKLNEILTAMCGQDGYELIINRHVGTVEILIKLNSVRLVDNAKEVIRRAAPADMGVTARILFNIHARFRSMTQAQLSVYTHYQLRNDQIFMRDFNKHAYVGRFTHAELSGITHKSLMEDEINVN